MDHKNTNGLWLMDHGQSAATDVFLLEDDTLVTLRLVSISFDVRAPKDGFYKLKARWIENELHFLNPSGSWTCLARFRNGIFHSAPEDEPYHMAKPEELSEEQKPILIPRGPWEYTN